MWLLPLKRHHFPSMGAAQPVASQGPGTGTGQLGRFLRHTDRCAHEGLSGLPLAPIFRKCSDF